MIKDDIQTWTLIAFTIVLALGLYKVYSLFNTPIEGPDTKTQYARLEQVVIDFLAHTQHTDLDSKELFELLMKEDDFKNNTYRNFNQNRLNQLLQQLYCTYEAGSLSELISIVKNEN